MTTSSGSGSCSPEIAAGVTAQDFLGLDLDAFPSDGWTKGIEALKIRIEKRYLKPLKSLSGLNDSDHTFGFIVLTAAFALVETLEGFRQGKQDHKGISEPLFKTGLQGLEITDLGQRRALDENESIALYKAGRCALLHSGGTDKITISVSGNTLEKLQDGRYKVNRIEFIAWIEQKFHAYLEELKKPDSFDLRDNFKTKMTYICVNA